MIFKSHLMIACTLGSCSSGVYIRFLISQTITVLLYAISYYHFDFHENYLTIFLFSVGVYDSYSVSKISLFLRLCGRNVPLSALMIQCATCIRLILRCLSGTAVFYRYNKLLSNMQLRIAVPNHVRGKSRNYTTI